MPSSCFRNFHVERSSSAISLFIFSRWRSFKTSLRLTVDYSKNCQYLQAGVCCIQEYVISQDLFKGSDTRTRLFNVTAWDTSWNRLIGVGSGPFTRREQCLNLQNLSLTLLPAVSTCSTAAVQMHLSLTMWHLIHQTKRWSVRLLFCICNWWELLLKIQNRNNSCGNPWAISVRRGGWWTAVSRW